MVISLGRRVYQRKNMFQYNPRGLPSTGHPDQTQEKEGEPRCERAVRETDGEGEPEYGVPSAGVAYFERRQRVK